MRTLLERILRAIFRPVDCSTLATFRILFGLLLTWETIRFWPRIESIYLTTKFPFRYPGFEFLPTPNELAFRIILVAMGVSALLVAIGLWYRVAACVLWLTYTFVFLLEQTSYNNHYYLTSLLCFCFMVTDAHADFSIDAGRLTPIRRTAFVPAWQVRLFQAQFFIVYFYGGIAKINSDWLHGEPMRNMLAKRSPEFPIAGFLDHEWVVQFFGFGGLFFDLSIGFLLFCRRTRPLAIVLLCFFHLTNNWLFDIGIFPWLGIAATVVFLEPDSPRRFFRTIKNRVKRTTQRAASNDNALGSEHRNEHSDIPAPSSGRRWFVCAFLVTYLLIQLLLPFRHLVYPDRVSWTEEGHNFSWHMKLRSKDGMYRFRVLDPATGLTEQFPDGEYLTERQRQGISTRPRLLLRFAHFIHDEYERRGLINVEVYVDSIASLNGRPYQHLIDPTVNLAAVQPRWCGNQTWIVPLDEGQTIGNYPRTHEERVEMMRDAFTRTGSLHE